MIKIINNLSDYNIPTFDQPIDAYILSGEDALSNIKSIVKDNFKNSTMLIKASGLMDNITSLTELEGKLVYFEQGDGNKFFIKKFPELLISFPNHKSLGIILEDWVCTCYEHRSLYFVDPSKYQLLVDVLMKCKFVTSASYDKIWGFVDAIVENVPEAPEHDTFLLLAKKQFNCGIENCDV